MSMRIEADTQPLVRCGHLFFLSRVYRRTHPPSIYDWEHAVRRLRLCCIMDSYGLLADWFRFSSIFFDYCEYLHCLDYNPVLFSPWQLANILQQRQHTIGKIHYLQIETKMPSLLVFSPAGPSQCRESEEKIVTVTNVSRFNMNSLPTGISSTCFKRSIKIMMSLHNMCALWRHCWIPLIIS